MATKTKQLPTGIADHEQVIPFEESFKCPSSKGTITFDAQSYQQWVYDTLPLASQVEPMDAHTARTKGMKIGEYVFYMRPMDTWYWASRYATLTPFALPFLDNSPKIAKRTKLELMRSGKVCAWCSFDKPVIIPVLAQPEYDGTLAPWMSLTPNEILSQRGQVRRSKGKVGMAGLGLGWAARRVLERKQVKHLTVVERDPDIIKHFGQPLKQLFSDKLTLVCGDAYEQDWLQYDVSMWDIWESYNGVAFDSRYNQIHRQIIAAGKTSVYWGSMS